MFNEQKITCDMKKKDKNSDKFKTGARLEDIISVDLRKCRHRSLDCQVSLGEYLRQNSEEYWSKYHRRSGEEHRADYNRRNSEECFQDYLRQSSEEYRSGYKGQSGEEYRSDCLTQSDEEFQDFVTENRDTKRKKSSNFISAMTKIARRKGKSSRRRSSVFIQFYSKLRKREESSGSVVQHAGNGNAQQTNCAANHQHGCVQHGTVLQQTELTVITASSQQPAEPPPFLWVYSSSNHSLDTQVHHSQDLLVRPDSCEVIDGECKNGIRKNLRGKWNRLVKKKPHHDIYTIPAELKPQLKQIYVY